MKIFNNSNTETNKNVHFIYTYKNGVMEVYFMPQILMYYTVNNTFAVDTLMCPLFHCSCSRHASATYSLSNLE